MKFITLLNKFEKYVLPFFGLVIIIGVLFATYNFVGSGNVTELVEEAGVWGPIIYILAHSLTIIVAPLGGEFLFLSSGILFGFWQGVLYSAMAGFLGAIVNFWIARVFGQEVVVKLVGKKNYELVEKYTTKLSDQNILIWLPFMSTGAFDLLCYVAGFTPMKFSKFLRLVATSTLINVPLYVGIGNGFIGGNWLVGFGFFVGLIAVSGIFLYLENKFHKKNN